jgi:2-C-methyl-D-erythritol 4-phosphate cytidylyltransferase
VVAGGAERHNSVEAGIQEVANRSQSPDDLILIHDGVRPLVKESVLLENIRVAELNGNAMTVRSVVETVVVTENEYANESSFKNRDKTYTLTSPQTFKVSSLLQAYKDIKEITSEPILDASIVYSKLGKNIFLVKEQDLNLKITTPEDFYYFRSILELEERKAVFGL